MVLLRIDVYGQTYHSTFTKGKIELVGNNEGLPTHIRIAYPVVVITIECSSKDEVWYQREVWLEGFFYNGYIVFEGIYNVKRTKNSVILLADIEQAEGCEF